MGAKKKSDKAVYQQQVPIVYGTRNHPQATVATIHTKGMSSSYKGKLKPVASPQPPPDYQLTVRKSHQKEFRPESSVYHNNEDSYTYCSTTSSYVTTDQSSRGSTVRGWRDQITEDMNYPTSRYMRDYMEYCTDKRKTRPVRVSCHSPETGTDSRGILRSHGGTTAKASRPLSRKASGRGRGVVTTSIRRRKSIRQRPGADPGATMKKQTQTLKSCRSVSEIETLLPRKAVQERPYCQQGSTYQMALERAKKASAAEMHHERLKQHGKCCGGKNCCNQR